MATDAEEMVLAQSLGDEDCQAPRDEKGAVIMHRIWVDLAVNVTAGSSGRTN
jgi:hypothetical protein